MAREKANKPTRTALEEAAAWYVALRHRELSNDQLVEWERWYADPENQKALEAVRRVTPDVGKLRRPRLLNPDRLREDDYDGSIPIAQWHQRAVYTKSTRLPWYKTALSFRIAAAILIAALGGAGAFGIYHTWKRTEPLEVFQTQAGQHRDVRLSDGSTVTLGARTKLTVHYTFEQRTVLLEQGEALFTVAHNAQRPFTVIADGGSITAVGTRFNVRAELNRVIVTVAEGAVDVTPAEPAGKPASFQTPADAEQHWQPARIVRGQEITYDPDKGRGLVVTAEPEATAWISGRLQFRQVALKYVAADVERYLGRPILFSDAAAGELEFTGVIDQTELGDWFEALQHLFPLEISMAGEGAVLIRTRSVEQP